MSDPDVDLDEELELVEYDPSWPDKYEREEGRIEEALDETDHVRIEHMGSTAVPGLDAKDVVDILVVVPSMDSAWECVERLESIGYEFHHEWNPEARERYETTKYEAVEAHADEPFEYTKAKSDTIDSILDDAREAGYGERI
ncbi:hypothetical protein BRC82_03960 [Halobacteriales archaeon QS_1_67_19]|nr:MAG: hypothetical protein BRC82_03960 [Halobacteriales archaeon QS_1_67_19]